MIKNDKWIKEQANKGMIQPFVPQLIRNQVFRVPESDSDHYLAADFNHTKRVISYGVSSFGYDIRLSKKDFKIFRHIPGTIIDPKNFNPHNLESAELHTDGNGSYFILPGHSYGLGVALERLEIPDNISVICMGKSTYARCGIIANLTPAEAGWKGHLTLEFSNSSAADARIYAEEGVVQLLFLEGDPCQISYETRQGKYQNQTEQITLPRL